MCCLFSPCLTPADGNQCRGNLPYSALRSQQVELCSGVSRVLDFEADAKMVKVFANLGCYGRDTGTSADDKKICGFLSITVRIDSRHMHIPGFGCRSSNTPQAPLGTSHCFFAFSSVPLIFPSTSPSFIHGRHRNASPPMRKRPLPLTRIWLFSANPSPVHASIEVAGAAVLRRTSSAPKSVCVSSSLFGPRSRDFGGLD